MFFDVIAKLIISIIHIRAATNPMKSAQFAVTWMSGLTKFDSLNSITVFRFSFDDARKQFLHFIQAVGYAFQAQGEWNVRVVIASILSTDDREKMHTNP